MREIPLSPHRRRAPARSLPSNDANSRRAVRPSAREFRSAQRRQMIRTADCPQPRKRGQNNFPEMAGGESSCSSFLRGLPRFGMGAPIAVCSIDRFTDRLERAWVDVFGEKLAEGAAPLGKGCAKPAVPNVKRHSRQFQPTGTRHDCLTPPPRWRLSFQENCSDPFFGAGRCERTWR